MTCIVTHTHTHTRTHCAPVNYTVTRSVIESKVYSKAIKFSGWHDARTVTSVSLVHQLKRLFCRSDTFQSEICIASANDGYINFVEFFLLISLIHSNSQTQL